MKIEMVWPPANRTSRRHDWHIALVLALIQPAFCHADFLLGTVTGVTDGDTITILDDERIQHRVRLAGIDAPERKQDFGERSKQRLSELVYRQQVVVEHNKSDRYGRLVGKIKVAPINCPDCEKTVDAGLDVLKHGLAWHYKKYASEQSLEDREQYSATEDEARAQHQGLWPLPNPVPPWEFRKQKR
jgi:endonuclease YncB( thermonuclease family)